MIFQSRHRVLRPVEAGTTSGTPWETRLARGVLAWLLAVALAAGCSWIPEYAWERFGSRLEARADDWLDLDAADEELLRARMAPWLETMRRERLPRYASLLRSLARRTHDDGFGPADAAWLERRVEPLYRDAVESALDWIAPTLADLDAGQQRHLAMHMREVNADYRDDHVDGPRDARADAMARRIIAQVERWTGRLDPLQRRFVRERAFALPDTAADWYRYRLRMQAGLLALLHADAGEAAIRDHLASWWVRQDTRRAAERRASEALRAGLRELLVALHGELTPAQRRETIRRLRRVADDLETVAASAPAAPAE